MNKSGSFQDQPPAPLIVCGMHRSGTSLIASLLESAGVSMGEELVGPARGNERGHFEDIGLLAFHARWLTTFSVGQEGFTDRPLPKLPESARDMAQAILNERAGHGRLWGWKEPRTTLFLDFWLELAPRAKFVMMFRKPWEVADSLFRRGEKIFLEHPEFAFRVWARYNQAVLDFSRRHSERCVVLEVSRLAADPLAAIASIGERLDLPLGVPAARYDAAMLQTPPMPTIEQFVRARFPEVCDLYDALRETAGESPIASSGPAAASAETPLASARSATAVNAVHVMGDVGVMSAGNATHAAQHIGLDDDPLAAWAALRASQPVRRPLWATLAYRWRRMVWKAKREYRRLIGSSSTRQASPLA